MTTTEYNEVYEYSPEEALRLAWYQRLSNVATNRTDLRKKLLGYLESNQLCSFQTERTRLLNEEEAQAGFFWTPSLSWLGSFLSWLTGFRILRGSRLREALLTPPSFEIRQLSELPADQVSTIPEPDQALPAFHKFGFKTAVFSTPEMALADFNRRLELAQKRPGDADPDSTYEQLLSDFVCLRQRLSPLLYQKLWRQLFAINKKAAYNFFFNQLSKPADRDGYDYNQIIKTDLCEYLCEALVDNQDQVSMKCQHAEYVLLALILGQNPLELTTVNSQNQPLMDWLNNTLGLERVGELSTPPRASCSGLNPLLDSSNLLRAAIEAYKKDPKGSHPVFLSFCKIAASRLAEYALLTQDLTERTSKLILLGLVETEPCAQSQAYQLNRLGISFSAMDHAVHLRDIADWSKPVNAKRFHNAVTINRAYHIATQIIIAWTNELQNPLESDVQHDPATTVKSPVEKLLSDARADYHDHLQNEATYEQVLVLLSAYHERLKGIKNYQDLMPRITARFELIRSNLQEIKDKRFVIPEDARAVAADEPLEDEEPESTAKARGSARTAPVYIASSLYTLFASCLRMNRPYQGEVHISLVPHGNKPGMQRCSPD